MMRIQLSLQTEFKSRRSEASLQVDPPTLEGFQSSSRRLNRPALFVISTIRGHLLGAAFAPSSHLPSVSDR